MLRLYNDPEPEASPMKSSLPAFALVVLAAVISRPAAAQTQADVLKPAHEFMGTFNKGDIKGAVAACAAAPMPPDAASPAARQRWARRYTWTWTAIARMS